MAYTNTFKTNDLVNPPPQIAAPTLQTAAPTLQNPANPTPPVGLQGGQFDPASMLKAAGMKRGGLVKAMPMAMPMGFPKAKPARAKRGVVSRAVSAPRGHGIARGGRKAKMV